MNRCDKPAVWLAEKSGFRACHECFNTMTNNLTVWLHYSEYGPIGKNGPKPFGRCDKPIETKDEFFSRYPDSNYYKEHVA